MPPVLLVSGLVLGGIVARVWHFPFTVLCNIVILDVMATQWL